MLAQRRRMLATFFSVAVAVFLPASYIQGALAAGSTSVQDFAQCANDPPPSTATNCPGSWINGILQATNSHYTEDDVVPQRLDLSVSGSTTRGTSGRTACTVSDVTEINSDMAIDMALLFAAGR